MPAFVLVALFTNEESVWNVGVIPGLRRGLWSILIEKIHNLLHWASLAAGVRRCWLRDIAKTNRAVQCTLQAGGDDCKVYHTRTPKWARKFLVWLGNCKNSEASSETFLQCYRLIDTIEAAFAKRKALMQWTIASIGKSAMNDKKMGMVHGMYPLKWKHYRSLEITIATWNAFTTEEYEDDVRFWDVFADMCQKDVDFTDDAVNRHSDIFQSLHMCSKVLKAGYPKEALQLARLTLPMREPVGQCEMMPMGLDTRKLRVLTDAHIANLMQSMDTSTLRKEGVDKKQKNANAKGKAESDDDEDGQPCEGETWLDSKRAWHDYVIKISDAATAQPYADIAMYCNVVGSVELTLKGKPTTLSRWSTLRNTVKSFIYRKRTLRPRATDPDFDVDEEEAVEAIEDDVMDAPLSDEEIKEVITESVSAFQLFSDHFAKNSPMMAASAHIAIAQATSKAIMTMMPQLAAGVSAGGLKDRIVTGIGTPVVEEVLPLQLFTVLSLVDSYGWEKIRNSVPADQKACIDNCRAIQEEHRISQDWLSHMRIHAFFYIGSQMASLPCRVFGNEGAHHLATQPCPLFTPLTTKLVTLAMHDTDHSSTNGVERQHKLMHILQRVSMKGRADDTFKTIVSSFFNSVEKLTVCNDKKIDLDAHKVARDALKEQLDTKDRAELVQFLKDASYTGITIPKSLDVFPVEKTRAVQAILKAFDNRNDVDSAMVEFSFLP